MASVAFDFVKPDNPSFVNLHIYEGGAKEGPFTLIETVPVVYPNYPTRYTTDQATNPIGWFLIEWEDDKGAKVQSTPIQGGFSSVVARIVQQMIARDSSLDESVATTEAAAAAERYFNRDPFTIPASEATWWQISGLTMMALARASLVKLAQSSSSGSADKWTAGLVTVQSGITNQALQSAQANIQSLLEEAATVLGLNLGVVAQMVVPEIAGGAAWYGVDISRLLVEVDA